MSQPICHVSPTCPRSVNMTCPKCDFNLSIGVIQHINSWTRLCIRYNSRSDILRVCVCEGGCFFDGSRWLSCLPVMSSQAAPRDRVGVGRWWPPTLDCSIKMVAIYVHAARQQDQVNNIMIYRASLRDYGSVEHQRRNPLTRHHSIIIVDVVASSVHSVSNYSPP